MPTPRTMFAAGKGGGSVRKRGFRDVLDSFIERKTGLKRVNKPPAKTNVKERTQTIKNDLAGSRFEIEQFDKSEQRRKAAQKAHKRRK